MFSSDSPFDLLTRSGSTSYISISQPLNEPWDGTDTYFPSTVVSLRLHSKEERWNTSNPCGILNINRKDTLTDYHSITSPEIELALFARVNARAIQKSRAMIS